MPITPPEEQTGAPAVSIGLPVYNGEQFIRAAVDSVLKQTYRDFELIIADNNSNDATREICREYMERDSRIKYIRHEKNYGGYWNFCFVAQQAIGQFFTWLSHDDTLEPQFLERTVQYLLQHPETVIAAVDFAVIDESGIELRKDTLEDTRDSLPWEIRRIPFFEFAYPNIHLCFYGLTQTKLCKSIMSGMKLPQMLTGMEYPILARFAAAGEIAALPIVLRTYRSHSESAFLTEVADNEKKSTLRRVVFFYGNLFKLRIDLLKVLLGAPFSWKAKLTILRRHMLMDKAWYRWKITGHWTPRPRITDELANQSGASEKKPGYGGTDARV
jgi:glycosyltransferase involved in cell wall biosynthesis